MSDRVFVDTNVFVYLFDGDTPDKQSIASERLRELSKKANVVLSTQVLQEFYVSVSRKLETPLPPDQAQRATHELSAYTVVQVDTPLIFRAIDLSQSETLSFWDALIVRAAAEAGCARILSEDFQDGRKFGATRVENPFVRA
jgi:predicted nucleic acid-binding protein